MAYKNPNTICIHSGTISSFNDQKSSVSSIFMSTANSYIEGENLYPRYNNSFNHHAVVKKLCDLEQTEDGVLFSSGMGAVSAALLAFLKPKDHVLLHSDLYGGTTALVNEHFPKWGIEYDFCKTEDEFKQKIKPNTRALYIETPSNPLLTVTSISDIVELARSQKTPPLTFIDNTFATPINQNPFKMGIDIVIHSGTKFLNGHSDLSAGVVLGSAASIKQIKHYTTTISGAALNTMDCWLLERGLKTLNLRIKEQNQRALDLAHWLEKQTHIVTQVFYPGLESHPRHNIAKAQTRCGYGGMLAIQLDKKISKNDLLSARSALKVVRFHASLGGMETIITIPSQSSHKNFSPEELIQLGITENTMRISVGIEDLEDLIQDFTAFFQTLSQFQ